MVTEQIKEDEPSNPSSSGQPPNRTIIQKIWDELKAAGLILVIVGACVYYFVYTAVPEKVKGEVSGLYSAKDGPLERIVKLETEAAKISNLETAQTKMQSQLVELNLKFDLYFDKTLDTNTLGQVVGRAVTRAVNTQDKIQQTAALNIAKTVLEKADTKRIVIDYKKINQFGLALLKQHYEADQRSVLKDTVAKLAKQRTQKNSTPVIPKDDEQKTKYIFDVEQQLDGTAFKDVTFVNSTINYDNGWIGLDNVRFINCTFEVYPLDTGKKFYEALFESDVPIPTVTVSTGTPLSNSNKL